MFFFWGKLRGGVRPRLLRGVALLAILPPLMGYYGSPFRLGTMIMGVGWWHMLLALTHSALALQD
ncbi:hypothetical protein CC79DRAFT_1336491 [Sarocladium strictum]